MLIVEAEVDIFLITEAEFTLQYLANPTVEQIVVQSTMQLGCKV
jgi:hypothetical protein